MTTNNTELTKQEGKASNVYHIYSMVEYTKRESRIETRKRKFMQKWMDSDFIHVHRTPYSVCIGFYHRNGSNETKRKEKYNEKQKTKKIHVDS